MFQDARQMLSGRTPLLLWRVGKRYRVQSRFLVVIDCYRAGMNQSNIVRTNNTLVEQKWHFRLFDPKDFFRKKIRTVLTMRSYARKIPGKRVRVLVRESIIPLQVPSSPGWYYSRTGTFYSRACSLDRAWFSIPARSYFTIIGFSALVHYSALDKILRLG